MIRVSLPSWLLDAPNMEYSSIMECLEMLGKER